MTAEQIAQMLKMLHDKFLANNSDSRNADIKPVSENEKLAKK